MLTALLEFAQAIPTITFNNTDFRVLAPSPNNFNTVDWVTSSPAKKGTLLVTSTTGYVKIANLTLTSAGDTDWVAGVKILVQNVRDIDTNAYVEGFRKFVNSDANVGDKVAVIENPGTIFEIGAQNTTDRQAGYDSSQAYTAGNRLYAAVNTATGAQNGGIWNLASQATSAGTVYCMPVGECMTTLAASATANMKIRFNPGFVHGSLYTS